MKKADAYSNGTEDEQCNYGNDIEQFGQLLAILIGNCHGSSGYNKVNKCHCLQFREKMMHHCTCR